MYDKNIPKRMIPYGIGIHYSIYFVEMTENENNAG
jgi:hypothetical protein